MPTNNSKLSTTGSSKLWKIPEVIDLEMGAGKKPKSAGNQRSEGERADSIASFGRIYGEKALGPEWKNWRKTKRK
jgi:hypothetical protein